jgi:hypothetical protein
MIKGITGGSNIVVNGGSVSYPYIPMNDNNPIQGMLRLRGQDLQVFDGNNWTTLGGSYSQIELTADVQSLLNWARQERDQQRLREKRIQENPALKKAYEAILRAEENYDILDRLVGEDNCDACEQVQSSP